jgi:SWI/SNF-related matrix-associated actin-dependent regulator of chromatin subfamily A3
VRNKLCPLCRMPYGNNDMITQGDAEAATQNKPAAKPKPKGPVERSPKMQALLDKILEMRADEKGVIFSQWTTFLNLIEAEFIANNYPYTRIDGSMSAEQRIVAMERFDTHHCDNMLNPRFVLCSLHACGTGINLTRGNWCFMMDPVRRRPKTMTLSMAIFPNAFPNSLQWWNSASENQAMGKY